MTKDEACQIALSNGCGSNTIETLIALGILKVEKPKTATERALNALNELFLDRFSEVTSEELCKALNEAGVRIVDR